MPNSNDYIFVAGISMAGLWLTWFLQGVASIIGKDYSDKTPVRGVRFAEGKKSLSIEFYAFRVILYFRRITSTIS